MPDFLFLARKDQRWSSKTSINVSHVQMMQIHGMRHMLLLHLSYSDILTTLCLPTYNQEAPTFILEVRNQFGIDFIPMPVPFLYITVLLI